MGLVGVIVSYLRMLCNLRLVAVLVCLCSFVVRFGGLFVVYCCLMVIVFWQCCS